MTLKRIVCGKTESVKKGSGVSRSLYYMMDQSLRRKAWSPL